MGFAVLGIGCIAMKSQANALARAIRDLTEYRSDLERRLRRARSANDSLSLRGDARACFDAINFVCELAPDCDAVVVAELVMKHGPKAAQDIERQRLDRREEIIASDNEPDWREEFGLKSLIGFYGDIAASPDMVDSRSIAEKQSQKALARRLIAKAVEGDYDDSVHAFASAFFSALRSAASVSGKHRASIAFRATSLDGRTEDVQSLDDDSLFDEFFFHHLVWGESDDVESPETLRKRAEKLAANSLQTAKEDGGSLDADEYLKKRNRRNRVPKQVRSQKQGPKSGV